MDFIRNFINSMIWGIGLNAGNDIYKNVKKKIKTKNNEKCDLCNSNLIHSRDYTLCTNKRCISNN
jgi:hypothetical protein